MFICTNFHVKAIGEFWGVLFTKFHQFNSISYALISTPRSKNQNVCTNKCIYSYHVPVKTKKRKKSRHIFRVGTVLLSISKTWYIFLEHMHQSKFKASYSSINSTIPLNWMMYRGIGKKKVKHVQVKTPICTSKNVTNWQKATQSAMHNITIALTAKNHLYRKSGDCIVVK